MMMFTAAAVVHRSGNRFIVTYANTGLEAWRISARFAAIAMILPDWLANAVSDICRHDPGDIALADAPGDGWAAPACSDRAQRTLRALLDAEWRSFSIRAVPILAAGEIREWVGGRTDVT